jgi:protein-disulfide isomerase
VKPKALKVQPSKVKPKEPKAQQSNVKPNLPKVKQGRWFVIAAVILLLAFIAAATVYKNQKSKEAAQAYQSNKSTFVRDHSPTLGNPGAKVEIVEFFDPACETCKEFAPLVKKLMAANPDRIRLYARYAPFHQGSDYVVKILEAAKRQGKFWETLDAVFASQTSWAPNHRPQPQLVLNYIGGVGLDISRLSQDMNAPEIEKIIQQDLADAKTLNVTMTPEFFVNGKPLPSFGADQLRDLVADALDSAYK